MKTSKTFDCVEMKRAAQRKIRRQVRGLTPEQEIAFFRAGAKEFEKAVKQAHRARTVGRGRRVSKSAS